MVAFSEEVARGFLATFRAQRIRSIKRLLRDHPCIAGEASLDFDPCHYFFSSTVCFVTELQTGMNFNIKVSLTMTRHVHFLFGDCRGEVVHLSVGLTIVQAFQNLFHKTLEVPSYPFCHRRLRWKSANRERTDCVAGWSAPSIRSPDTGYTYVRHWSSIAARQGLTSRQSCRGQSGCRFKDLTTGYLSGHNKITSDTQEKYN